MDQILQWEITQWVLIRQLVIDTAHGRSALSDNINWSFKRSCRCLWLWTQIQQELETQQLLLKQVRSVSSGNDNTYLGRRAGFANVTGENNVAIGVSAMEDANSSAENNVCIGKTSGFALTGDNNTALGLFNH